MAARGGEDRVRCERNADNARILGPSLPQLQGSLPSTCQVRSGPSIAWSSERPDITMAAAPARLSSRQPPIGRPLTSPCAANHTAAAVGVASPFRLDTSEIENPRSQLARVLADWSVVEGASALDGGTGALVADELALRPQLVGTRANAAPASANRASSGRPRYRTGRERTVITSSWTIGPLLWFPTCPAENQPVRVQSSTRCRQCTSTGL